MIQLLCMLIGLTGTFSVLMATFSNYVSNEFLSNLFMVLSSVALCLIVAFVINVLLYLTKALMFDKRLKRNMSEMTVEDARINIKSLSGHEIEPTVKSLFKTLLQLKLPEKRMATMVFNDLKNVES